MVTSPRPGYRWRRALRAITRLLAWGALLLVITMGVARWWARPDAPDAFYRPPPGPLPAAGTLLRQDIYSRDVPAGAQAWRILYATTRADGTATAASAVVVVRAAGTGVPRPVVLWTHGTTGVAAGCAPSIGAPFANVPAFPVLLDEGWALVAPDYPGQGVAGPNPYLVGEGQARAALDAVKAARGIAAARLGDATVIWGHSQGGHAALWTAQRATAQGAASFRGVAAAAPATDLPRLVSANQHAPIGRLMSAYIVQAYADAYPDVTFEGAVRPGVRWLARDIARQCLLGRRALVSVGQAMAAGGSLFAHDPAHGAIGARLAQNVPRAPIAMPVLLAQGGRDELVRPELQAAYVRQRCAQGQVIDFRRYAADDHLSLVAPGGRFSGDLISWTRARFDGRPGASACSTSD